MLRINSYMFFALVTLLFYVGTLLGSRVRTSRDSVSEKDVTSFKTLESATLALLGLLLGFTFSMAVGRYDTRKQLELTESNAVSNTWRRTASLPEPARSEEQALLRQYVPQRLEFLNAGTSRPRIYASLKRTAELQRQMWSIGSEVATADPDALNTAFLDSLTQSIDVTEARTAAFENRIPVTAWGLLLFIGFVASILVGIGLTSRSHLLRLTLPVVVASALTLTLMLDSPRSGLIKLHQRSLDRMWETVEGPVPQGNVPSGGAGANQPAPPLAAPLRDGHPAILKQ